ncbi:MAG: arsenite methyltransferase [Actinomycetota bacterium]|nr:arsenite methyltransferase [Actinomycetota bacterium]
MTSVQNAPDAPDVRAQALRDEVRDRYATAALAVLNNDPTSGGCCPAGAECGCGCGGATHVDGTTHVGDATGVDQTFGSGLYDPDQSAELPASALAASLGCGNPIAVAELLPGETVLDLGSGGGIDVILSARRVGDAGKAYGLDMTDEMLQLARGNVAEAGVRNVEFLRGHIEDIPLPANSVDVVISNCVINLSVDKPAVFSEMYRVLRPGGRIGVSDVVAEDRLTPAERAERGDYAGCIAGALSNGEYLGHLRDAGFEGASVTFTHEVADGLHGAIVRAVKPI